MGSTTSRDAGASNQADEEVVDVEAPFVESEAEDSLSEEYDEDHWMMKRHDSERRHYLGQIRKQANIAKIEKSTVQALVDMAARHFDTFPIYGPGTVNRKPKLKNLQELMPRFQDEVHDEIGSLDEHAQ